MIRDSLINNLYIHLQVDDFVVQFLDRCFALIESSSFEQTREEVSTSDHRSNREETMKDIGMASTFNSILVQSSSDVYNVALKKVNKKSNNTFLNKQSK